MARTSFRLQSLLNIKVHCERERQREHANSLARYIAQEELLRKQQDRQRQTLEHQRGVARTAPTARALLEHSRYLVRLRKEELGMRELSNVLKREVDQRQRLLLDATKERRMFEKLKEKEAVRELARIVSLEQKEMDEAAANLVRRKLHRD